MKEIAALFFKLGCIAFGGPAAHIAMMEEEVVVKRKWMDRQHFLDLVGATNLIPGPNSTEMAIHCGYHRGGFPGLLVAGAAFILPASLISIVFAWLYASYGTVPAIEPFFFGIKPAVLAVILSAVVRLGRRALKGWKLGVLGAGVLVATLAGVGEIAAILGGGIVGMLWLFLSEGTGRGARLSCIVPSLFPFAWDRWHAPAAAAALAVSAAGVAVKASSLQLFLVFLKVGAILFGSGYVLVAYLDAELIERLGWLTRPQLLDAIAIGQFTPGPVLSASTFIGYQLAGLPGAAAATAGIFLPSFVFVFLLNPLVPKLRTSRLSACFLDAVNMSAIAVMASVLAVMGTEIVVDWRSTEVALLALALTFKATKLGSGWIVLVGAIAGYALWRL